MCGIIGVSLKNITPEQLAKIHLLIEESSIRGIHATGISYLHNHEITTIKDHLAAKYFSAAQKLLDYRNEDGGLYMIAHTRYSTSDLKFNQPLGNDRLVIVHNGIISQSNPKSWKKEFRLKTKTTNDSELILQCLNGGNHPLNKFKGSMAVCGLYEDGEIFAFRNSERPLWHSQEDNGVVFASTKDILLRSGFKNPIKCDMFTEYVCCKGILTKQLFTTPVGVKDLQ